MQVYLPDDLYERVKQRSGRLNVSGILQKALAEHLARLEREEALGAAVRSYEAEFGAFSDEELVAQSNADDQSRVHPRPRKKRSPAA